MSDRILFLAKGSLMPLKAMLGLMKLCMTSSICRKHLQETWLLAPFMVFVRVLMRSFSRSMVFYGVVVMFEAVHPSYCWYAMNESDACVMEVLVEGASIVAQPVGDYPRRKPFAPISQLLVDVRPPTQQHFSHNSSLEHVRAQLKLRMSLWKH
jgi:hypothetical protein